MNQAQKNKIEHPFLFSPLKVGKIQLKNRLVALPVHTGFAHTDGSVSSWMIDFYARLADSGVGMVIVANTAVSRDGVVSKFNLRADRNKFIPGLSKLANAIKKKGAIACLQLNHGGRFARTSHPLLPSPITGSNLSFNLESLKKFMEFFPFEKRFSLTRYLINQVKTWRHAMTLEDRKRVMNDFAASAFRAYLAGFDMVELHGANGYLLCQYLSPFTNKIISNFGGDFAGRTAFPLAVIRQVKQKLPNDFPLGFRIILREWVPGGIDLPESLEFAKCLEKEQIAYLSASAGTYLSIFFPSVLKKMDTIAYLEQDMERLTKKVGIPTIISGRIISPIKGDEIIQNRTAHLIGLGRPLRTDPQWVAKARDPSQKIIQCINCHWCLKKVVLEKGFTCRRWPKLVQEKTELAHKLLTRNYNPLWIITGQKDIDIFKKSWPLLVQGEKNLSCPTILFLRQLEEDPPFDVSKKLFLQWIQNKLGPPSLDKIFLNYDVKESSNHWGKAIHQEILSGNHGKIFMGLNREQPWRERLLYKERGKVIVHLSANEYQTSVLVPVDLSDATLLVMSFLKHTHMEKKGFSFNFVHVVTDFSGQKEQRWIKLKKIAGFRQDIPLNLIFTKTEVASTLVHIMQTKKHGTIVMGKRGLSGMKRWLLGSVSSGVIEKLTDQSFFLID